MHLFIYNIFLFLYSIGIRITSQWNPKARKWREGRQHIWEEIPSTIGNRQSAGPAAANRSQKEVKAPKRGKAGAETGGQKQDEANSPLTIDHSPLVWMHCSSLGEFEQGRPVMEAIRQQYPQAKILLTFFSPSGYEVRKNNSGADYVMYLPMDSKTNARKFISLVQPNLVIWIKYEYWFYYLTELKKKQIPLLLVSGIFRQDQPFFKWYGRLHWYMLESFNHLFVQTPKSKQLLGTIGFSNNVTISGDTRFDRVVQIAEQFQPIDKIAHFCGDGAVVVAGSTWPEDEEEMDHYANSHPEIKFIIAPHEINEDHLKEIEKLFKHTVRFSRLPDNPEAPRPVPRNRQPESSA